ncbi:hypothetical protein OMW55_07130 [Sphingomonas sp. BN140010]|uniref:Uncharacterized protein n=1 Tax=Sphingomonas arvum TaxID=2992113 RepID=A0ABT3JEU1_9SPHN|nr:DUF6544 family protein [Sphingomonas sp. BN140010]MCW3797574.1 hypothetical protein [Sphingomonas sp. BN140010]
MGLMRKVALGAGAVLGAGVALGAVYRQSGARDEQRVHRAMLDAAELAQARFDEQMLAGLPEVAKRYLRHAIAPGTPLATTVELDMRGTFLLGDTAEAARAYAMTARETLAPSRSAFLWQPRLVRGPVIITGSDGLHDGKAWTRFWVAGLVPVVNEVSSGPDLVRSAAFRAAAEAIWVPSTLLPQAGARWRQVGPDQAEVSVPTVAGPIANRLTLAPDGRLLEVVGQRWSNANPDKVFRLQPFGGTVLAERRFGGFTVPARVSIGNHFGTPDFLPFFQAEITAARFR